MGPLAGGAQGGAPPTCTTGTHIHIHRCVLRCMGIYRYATSIDKYCHDILNSMILQCTNDWGRYSSYENGGGGKFVPVEERIRSSGTVFCFQWNAFPQQQMLKNSQEITIIASPALPLEAFPPSSGSENGCHFIEMPPPIFTIPPHFLREHVMYLWSFWAEPYVQATHVREMGVTSNLRFSSNSVMHRTF